MKVFYVMVLVLVAGAVPSHGRTESEGTVFNKTQPHESMNNVTVNSSKMLVPYEFLFLAMQWPRSFCNSNGPCFSQSVPGIFTVHGLWPQHNIGRYIDCTNRPYFGRYLLLTSNQMDNLKPDLDKYWPDLKTSGNNNYCFWVYEYNKHGSCTFKNPIEYFEFTLGKVKHLEVPLSELISRELIPGKSYSPDVIKNAVKKFTSLLPVLKCVKIQETTLLLEIRFCAERNNERLDLVNCARHVDCGNEMVFFPPASPVRI